MNRIVTKIGLLIVLIGSGLTAQSTLHVIYNINDKPQDSIYYGCQLDRQETVGIFGLIDTIVTEYLAGEAGPDFRVKLYRVPHRYDAVQAMLNDLPNQTEPEDGVIFVYSGHGFNHPNKVERWPSLDYCPEGGDCDPATSTLSLEEIYNRIKSTNVRMSLTIGSACNNTIDANDRQLEREKMEHARGSKGAGVQKLNDFDLFSKFRGHIIASASSPGEYGYLNDSIGSYYLSALLNVMSDAILSESGGTWASIFEKTTQTVKHVMGKTDQTPQFLMEVPEFNKPLYSGTETETEEYQPIDKSLYDEAWEEAFNREEAMEMLPYLLIQTLIETFPPDRSDRFDEKYSELERFYDQRVLRPHYDGYYVGLAGDYLELTIEDFNDEDYFEEEVVHARKLLPDLGDELRFEVEQFLETFIAE